MIEDRYLSGKTVPPYDRLVSAVADYDFLGGGNTMQIGVENADGEVYRVISATGMGVFMHVVMGLQRVGFKDLLDGVPRSRNGLDCRFQPTDMVYQVLEAEVASESAESPERLLSHVQPEIAHDLVELASGDSSSTETERITLVAARVGQGPFREQVAAHWKSCAVTGFSDLALLRASHIKPWAVSNNIERLDPNNGLLLTPNLDAAFDKGLVSFEDDGSLVLSVRFAPVLAAELHIEPTMRLKKGLLTDAHRSYLRYHRTHVLKL